MTSYTAPYAADAEDRIRFSSRHVITATAYPADGGDPVDLSVESASVSTSESRYPRWQADLVCTLPDQATLDRLDTRMTYWVQISAGYVWNSVTQDIQPLAKLHARTRNVNLPASTVELTLAGGELLAEDIKYMSTWTGQPTTTSFLAFVHFFADQTTNPLGLGPATVISDMSSQWDTGAGAAAVAGTTVLPGSNAWSPLQDAANRAGVGVYCDENGDWRISAPMALSSQSSLKLNAGGGGLIVNAVAAMDKSQFHNGVCLAYKWVDSANTNHQVYGNAWISSGSLSVSGIGWNSYYEERQIPATQAQANAAATNALTALARRGIVYTVNAVNALWLRVGQTVTVDLPGAIQDRLLVSGITWNFPSGQMTLTLRRPEEFEIANQ